MSATTEEKIFWRYTLNRRWSNASLLRHRAFDGHIVTMHQSGTHWLKTMLSTVLRHIYDLPAPEYIQDNDIVGHTKERPKYAHIPQIVNSHGYPHALTLRLPLVHFPRYLVLMRGLRESLVSHYERFKGDYGDVDFSTYLRGDVRQKKFHSDIFSRMRFMNEWGNLIEAYPDRIGVVKYEDMREDTTAALKRVCDFFKIEGATRDICAQAVEESRREKMAKKHNPEITTTVVRREHKPVETYYTPENQRAFEDICRRFLLHDFGYGYPTKTGSDEKGE